MEKLVIVDGNSLVNRAYYAVPYLSNSKGQLTGAVYGFVNMLIKVIQTHKPSHILVAFDHARKTFRNQLYEAYKGTRKPMPEELRVQIPLLKQVLDTMGISRYEMEGIEADDIIGTVAKRTDIETIILSGDRDVFQLIDDTTKVCFTKKGITETQMLDEKTLLSEYQYLPSQVPDLKGLMGDSSDNIPGIAGIGPKTALELISKYKSLENVINSADELKGAVCEKIKNGKEIAILSKQLATIKTDCNIDFALEDFGFVFPFSNEVYQLFEQLEFKSILAKKEIFESVVEKPKTIKFAIKEIKTKQDLVEFVSFCKSEKLFAFNFFKFEFAFDEKAKYVISRELSLFSIQELSDQDIVSSFKELIEDDGILKITNDLKSHLRFFKNNNLFPKGEIFDVSISNYLINAGKKISNDFENLVQVYKSHNELLKDYNLFDLYQNIELPLCYVLFEMEEDGFKIDKTQLELAYMENKEKLENLTKTIHQMAGCEFNINSPKQVSEVLFSKLGLSSKNNKNSTKVDVLEQLVGQHEIIPYIMTYRKTAKLLSTYLEPYIKMIESKGDVIHTVFNQVLTSTGRLSSSEPNLQNIPVRDDDGKTLRKIFVSKHENGVLLSADYNQIELRLLACFSGDENMLEAYKQGKDIHSATASKIFDVNIEDVTPSMRREAKAVNFGVVYGISDFGLASTLSCSRQKAKNFIENYFSLFPKIKTYLDMLILSAKNLGYSTTLFNRRRNIEELHSSKYVTRQFGERVAMNSPLQGSASDIIKLAMIKVFNALKENNLKSQLILQIHDELIIDCDQNEIETVRKIVKDCMENVTNLPLPLPVEINIGKNWYDCK